MRPQSFNIRTGRLEVRHGAYADENNSGEGLAGVCGIAGSAWGSANGGPDDERVLKRSALEEC